MKTYKRVQDILQKDIDSGMTLRALCRKVDLHPNTVGNYLEGRAEPTQQSLEKISAAYHVSIAWLRGDTDNPLIHKGNNSEFVDISTLSAESRALWDILQKAPPKKIEKWLALVNMLEKED